MYQQRHTNLRMPTFFTALFCIAFSLGVTMLGFALYMVVSAISLGPDGIAKTIGSVVGEASRAYDEAKSR